MPTIIRNGCRSVIDGGHSPPYKELIGHLFQESHRGNVSTTAFERQFRSRSIVPAGITSSARLPWRRIRIRIRIGIIGATGKGDYGHGVDVAASKVPNVEIVALADASDAGREAASKRTNPARTYADYHEMLRKETLDVAVICPRWIDQHHEMILASAQAGCHIYMEKPFCPTLAECDSAIKELQKKNLKLGIAHVTQYSPVLDVVKSLINSGEIGDVLEFRGRGKEDQRGGGEDLWVLGSQHSPG